METLGQRPTYVAAEPVLYSRSHRELLMTFLGNAGKAEDRQGWQMLYSKFH